MGRPKHGCSCAGCPPAAVLPAAPAYTFGTRHDSRNSSNISPGPNAYDIRLASSNFKRAPGIGFGTGTRGEVYGNKNPAPTDYQPQDRFARHVSPAYTFRGVNARNPLAKNPAPNQYSPERSVAATHPVQPSVSIVHKHPPPESYEKRPAPGEYGFADYAAKDSKAVSMKFRHPMPVDKALVAPGPGEYKRPSSLSGPKYTFGQRFHTNRQAEAMPGPADYNTHCSTIGVAGKSEEDECHC